MDFVTMFVAILLGVVLSIVLPIAFKWVTLERKKGAGIMQYIKVNLMPYIKAGVGAVIISVAILLIAPQGLESFNAAVMLGFGWEAFFKNLMTQDT